MTAYEWIKTGGVLALCYCLFCLGDAAEQVAASLSTTTTKLNSTLVTTQATLDTLNGIGPQAVSTLKSVDTTVKSVGKQATASLRGVNQTLDGINRLCGVPGKPCGTLADVNRTLASVRGTVGQIEVAARHENRNLDTLDEQEKQVVADLHTTSINLNALVASPDVQRFLKASADTSVQVAAIANGHTQRS